jgi:uncharacterized protein
MHQANRIESTLLRRINERRLLEVIQQQGPSARATLTRVSGLSGSVAKAVVRWRDANGVFKTRQDLLKVTGLGAKTFEQSAGFLRIRGGDNPLDMTGVHPETYPVVEQIIVKTAKPI